MLSYWHDFCPLYTKIPIENAICINPTENDYDYPDPNFLYQLEYKTNIDMWDAINR